MFVILIIMLLYEENQVCKFFLYQKRGKCNIHMQEEDSYINNFLSWRQLAIFQLAIENKTSSVLKIYERK